MTDLEITHIDTAVAANPWKPWLFVRVETADGIVGYGEGTGGSPEDLVTMVEMMKPSIIGTSAFDTERLFAPIFPAGSGAGPHRARQTTVLSAIDIALWDIAGKYHDVPAYRLLGGPTRTKARVYAHVYGETTDELVRGCELAKERGFTAVGHLNPLGDEPRSAPYERTHAEELSLATDRVERFREAVGTDVDLCIEIHRRLDPEEAIALGRAIEPYHPLFFEDPTRPDNFDAMARIANAIDIPIATGERIHTSHEFEMLLARNAVDFVRPDVCMVGGLSHAKKIAALAEAHYAKVVPHNPLSPVSTAACLQLAAAIPNFAIQEYPYKQDGGEPGRALLAEPLERDGGYLVIPDGPGIGVALDDEALEDHPYEPRSVVTRRHADGSIVDM